MNVVLIVADQLNHRFVCDANGNQPFSPNIDSLGASGAIFDNAYCQAPLCMPSRASFNTGIYPHACRARHNPVRLDSDFPTLAECLAAQGYKTGGFGHLGGDGADRGFEQKIDFWQEPLRSAYGNEQAFVLRDGGRSPTSGGVHPFPLEKTFDGITAEAATDFINSTNGPFYLQVSFMRPHIPLFVPEPYAGMVGPDEITLPPSWCDSLKHKPSNVRATRIALEMEDIEDHGLRSALALYADAVRFIDGLTGRIVDCLEKKHLLGDTLIVFTSDHGDYAGEFGIIGKTGQFYDSLVRVPLIMSCPSAGIPSGRRAGELVALVDVVPTILEACGVGQDQLLQGSSRLSLARGVADRGADAVFASTSGHGGEIVGFHHQWKREMLKPLPTDSYSSGPCSHVMDGIMVRSGDWKLCSWGDGSAELYNLNRDPWERDNLAADPGHAGTIAELQGRLLRWQMNTWLPDKPQESLPYHYRSAWIESIPEQWRARRLKWEAEHD